jgi:hypothetical protein
MESQDSATFIAEVGPSRAEYVRQVLGTARATLARSRGDNQFRERAAEPLGGVVPKWRSRERPLTSRDRTPPAPAPAPQPDAPTWEHERGAVLDALRCLCQLCETLHERIIEIQKRPWHAAYHVMAEWGDAECAHIEEASQKREQEPLELPSLRALRQNTDA